LPRGVIAVLTVDEYLALRKQQDHLNEFDVTSRSQNLRACVNYMLDYFTQYLEAKDAAVKLDRQRSDKFRSQLEGYSIATQDWLVTIYEKYGKHMHRTLANVADSDSRFLLYHTEKEFEALTNNNIKGLVRNNTFLKGQEQRVLSFLKEYQKVKAERTMHYYDLPSVTPELSAWLNQTADEYGVSIAAFAYCYLSKFLDDREQWPLTHRIKTNEPHWPYDYNHKRTDNLFNLDQLFPKIEDKPFLQGRRRELEIVMMYYWLHCIYGDEQAWIEYVDSQKGGL